MLCSHCKERQATVFLREEINGIVKEICLCDRCAAELGAPKGMFVPAGFVSSIFAPDAGSRRAPRQDKVCPVCGTRYSDFARTGLLGCENCYRVFRAELEPVLRKMHGKTRHEGKVPGSRGEDYALLREYNELTAEKEQAVVEERFEDAAEINKRLREVSEALKKKGLK